jgi:aminoglycoside-2''-adenylyltransferase
MIEEQYLAALHKIHARLKDCKAIWVITGSLGMALQGLDLNVHDIDLQTDRLGAFEIESKFSQNVIEPVHYFPSERMRSYFGKLEMDGIQVEIMGELQKRLDGNTWEEPVNVEYHRRWVDFDGMQLPVLSLEYEYQAYLKLGRVERAEMVQKWLQAHAEKKDERK